MTTKIIITNNFKTSTIAKVDEVFYMPKPSYENFPAIPLYTSNDGLNWELSTHAIKNTEKLNLVGIDATAGIWSPSLSHYGKRFYLVYSVVKSFGGNNLNLDNYIISTTDIKRKWSDPVYLNSNKAASILIHQNTKSYLISLRINIESEYEPTRCIVMQEFDKKNATLIGEETIIAKPVARGDLFSEVCFEEDEGVFKLTLVEITQNKKRSTVLTSPELQGMYHVLKFVDDIIEETVEPVESVESNKLDLITDNELIDLIIDDINPITSIADAAEIVEEIIGAITVPTVEDEEEVTQICYNDNSELGIYTLREDISDDWFKKVKYEDGFMYSLRGRNSLSSKFEQSFIGKSITTTNYTFQTKLNFKPKNIYQSAGIACYYNTDNYYYLRLYNSESFGGLTVGITSSQNGVKSEILHHGIKIGEMIENVHLKVVKTDNMIQFSYSLFSGSSWVNVSTPIDVSSVEAKHDGTNLVGITASDQNNKSVWANFYGMNLY